MEKEDRIFIVADSAISTTEEINNYGTSYSAFGELQDKYNDYFVYEHENKITRINDNVTVCFSGVVSHAFDMLRIFEEVLSYGVSIDEAIQVLNNSATYSDVDLIIGYTKDNETRLFLIKEGQVIEGDLFEIGSGAGVSKWSESMRFWLGINYPIEHVLTIMVVVMQATAMTIFMLPEGVGGTLQGLNSLQREADGVRICHIVYIITINNMKDLLLFLIEMIW